MQLHIDKAYEIINGGLPPNYLKKVMDIDPELTSYNIRRIKSRRTRYPLNHIKLLNILVAIAKEYKTDVEKLKNLIE